MICKRFFDKSEALIRSGTKR